MERLPEIVVTGVGVASSLGIGREAFWDGFLAGRSGVAAPRHWDVGTLPMAGVGEVPDFAPAQWIENKKSIKLMCRETQLACASAALAMKDAGADKSTFAAERFGVIYGSEMLYGQPFSLQAVFARSKSADRIDMQLWGRYFPHEMSPLWMLNYLPNMPACHIGIAHHAFGPCNTIVQGDVSGLLALIEAVTVMERGWADVMLVGSVGNTISPSREIYLRHEHLVTRGPAGETACRPFDATSGGMIAAEGAASLLLERRADAAARGARPLAEVAGFSRHWAPPPPGSRYAESQGIARCLRAGLEAADIRREELGHVNAHGTGYLPGDRQEAQAIAQLLGETPVTAPKGHLAHAGAGCGSLEAVVSVLALQHGLVPPILHYAAPDPACPIRAIRDTPLPVTGKCAVLMNQSTTGQLATVVLRPA